MQSVRLEIYLRNGKKQMIETETPMDWHFWRDGQQVAVYSHSLDGKGHYGLYDAASAHLVEELAEPENESLLPEWAKGPAAGPAQGLHHRRGHIDALPTHLCLFGMSVHKS